MYYKYNLFLSKTVRKNRYKIKKNIANYNVEYKNVIVNLNFSGKNTCKQKRAIFVKAVYTFKSIAA